MSAANVGSIFFFCGRIRHGCGDAAELQGAHGHPGTRFPSGPQRQGHGGHRSDRLWENLIGETQRFSADAAQEAWPLIKHSCTTFSLPPTQPPLTLPSVSPACYRAHQSSALLGAWRWTHCKLKKRRKKKKQQQSCVWFIKLLIKVLFKKNCERLKSSVRS